MRVPFQRPSPTTRTQRRQTPTVAHVPVQPQARVNAPRGDVQQIGAAAWRCADVDTYTAVVRG